MSEFRQIVSRGLAEGTGKVGVAKAFEAYFRKVAAFMKPRTQPGDALRARRNDDGLRFTGAPREFHERAEGLAAEMLRVIDEDYRGRRRNRGCKLARDSRGRARAARLQAVTPNGTPPPRPRSTRWRG